MSIVARVVQQPADTQDYDIVFSDWFPAGDEITDVRLSVTPEMPMPPSYAIQDQTVKLWVYAGGQHGIKYQISLCATTNDGRSKEVEIFVTVKEL